MKNLLLPTDFSTNARSAIAFAMRQFDGPDVTFHLLHATVPYAPIDTVYPATPVVMEDTSLQQLENEKAWILKHYSDLQGAVVIHHQRAGLLHATKDLMENHPIDLIAVGAFGLGKMAKILGSHTLDLLNNIKIPMLVVPLHCDLSPIQNIHFASDLKPLYADSTLDPLVSIAKRAHAKINLIHVAEPDHVLNQSETKTCVHLRRLLKSEVTHRYLYSQNQSLEEGLIRTFNKYPGELLTVVRHDQGFFYRLLHRSLSKALLFVFGSKLPVLVLHDEAY